MGKGAKQRVVKNTINFYLPYVVNVEMVVKKSEKSEKSFRNRF